MTIPYRATTTLHEKVAQLRQVYSAKLPDILADMRFDCTLLAQAPTEDRIVDALHRNFHNLKGTTASLGLPAISAESAAAAALITRFRRFDRESRLAHLARILDGLTTALSRLEALAAAVPVLESPLSPPSSGAFALASTKREAISRRRVVFYCDNDFDGTELGTQMTRFGYAVAMVTDPVALKSAVLADPPDAVLLSTAATAVMADLRRAVAVPALFVATQADFESRLKAVQAGGAAYLVKPVAAHDVVDILERVVTHQEPDPFRILIIDDEPEAADYHAAILDAAGMIVRRLEQPALILEELDEFQPDLVLMDMYMPGSSGHDLSRLIRQIPQFVSLPIIFLSSETDKTVQIVAMQVGADGFLTKPIIPEDLVIAVAVRAERTRVLRSLMMEDSLTGVLNHTTLSRFLDTALASARRNDGRLCFVMLDLDHFKKVNDTFGHPAGDQVLVALARMLRQRLRSSDMVGRYGGEEFAIVLQDVSVAEAAGIVDQIRQDFMALVFTAGDTTFSCTFSGGIASFPARPVGDDLVEAADQALYSAKAHGRNRIETADPA